MRLSTADVLHQMLSDPDGRTDIKFKEEGINTLFPDNLVSDGNIYAFCIMTAVLSRVIEPERGIHPQTISELVSLMRDRATTEHPVFVTTHRESIVRGGRRNDLSKRGPGSKKTNVCQTYGAQEKQWWL